MPPRRDPLPDHVAFRAPPARLARLDAVAVKLSTPHHEATRSEIGRAVLELGLVEYEARHAEDTHRRRDQHTVNVAFRASSALTARLDAMAAQLSTPDHRATRSEVASTVFELGMEAFEAGLRTGPAASRGKADGPGGLPRVVDGHRHRDPDHAHHALLPPALTSELFSPPGSKSREESSRQP
jgi:predicted transcriptional regulator